MGGPGDEGHPTPDRRPEKEDGTGDISYDAENHERMTHLRAAKVAKVAEGVPPLEVDDPSGDAELLVLGSGSTYGTIRASARRVREAGRPVATAPSDAPQSLPREHR